MATIYADSQDGYVARFNQSSWSNARATTTGTAASTATQNISSAVSAYAAAARGGSFGSKFGTGEGILSELFGKQGGKWTDVELQQGEALAGPEAIPSQVWQKGTDPSRFMDALEGTFGKGKGSLEDIFKAGGKSEQSMKLLTMLLGPMMGGE